MKQLKANNILNNDGVYLTFDDGPEPGITEFVLNELSRYNAKATFFCVGENIEKYPHLYEHIVREGHTIACHTHSHINAYHVSCKTYLNNIEQFDMVVRTHLFRPPWGALTLKTFFSIQKNKNIVLWHISSNDFALNNFNLEASLQHLKKSTKNGKIILFHFCKRHENETKQILPLYIKWLYSNNYNMKSL